MTTKEEVKAWLKTNKKTYSWLATKLDLNPATVGNMFSKKGVLSHRAVLIIETLMNKRQLAIPVEFEVTATIKLTTQEHAYFTNLAKDACLTTEEWVVAAIRYAGEHPEVVDEFIRQDQRKKNAEG